MKPKRPTDPIDFDMEFNPAIAAGKMPTNITGGIKPLSDFMELPCSKIVEYQNKQASDFRPWSDEKFQLLVDSIKRVGVIEPITVRPLSGAEDAYEILAGEHRWKGCKEAGLKTIPAHVLRDCGDEMASDVFSMTNVLRRDNSIRDKINGWWHYVQAIHYKRGADIQRLVDDGILKQEVIDEAKSGMRSVYRYARMHNLIDEFVDLADQKHLSLVAGEQLSFLTEKQQADLLPYKHSVNDKTKAEQLHKLAVGKLEGKVWGKTEIEEILFPSKKSNAFTLKNVTAQVGNLIRDKVPKEAYGEVEGVVARALDEFIQAHPEYQKPENREQERQA